MIMDSEDVDNSGEGLSDLDVSAHAVMFLAAGSETSANVLQ